ncbi:hypothetical protein XPR_0463 [Xanthomonas arboricola pv. pruni MAFF 301420]|uniref:Uncharacterized protein n=2 Tax=Xanthomonas arboricola pv. pruni TaxID=69929 RepID=W4SCA9_9XANT|nr:hypothetical protein XPU_2637 [Xanthomonas arboricola pv. pruni str. MAFF 311562]GAE53828.1 hypothetical protein XPR_0463 [Xanthomonas arboricola pv. pruni MAFF 301420]GAE60233.1 hypothetical protein XPN_2139 [Xanthomonas arboricola pv. pruni MAFF 301427]
MMTPVPRVYLIGLTPEQYLASQIAELNADACKKAQACYMVPSGTSVIAR